MLAVAFFTCVCFYGFAEIDCYDFRIVFKNGARGRTRTDTRLPLPDFESGASTDFTTRANKELRFYLERYKKEIKKA
jgi:hypothetical protein